MPISDGKEEIDVGALKDSVRSAAGFGAADVNEGVAIPREDEEAYNDVEQEAISRGWNPEGVEGKRNLSAEEFLDRQPLYDDIRSLKKQTRKLQEGMEATLKMVDGARKREREKVLEEYKLAKREALEDGDFDTVLEIDEKIADAKAEADAPLVNEAYIEWVADNEWYVEEPKMKEYAETIGAGYFQKNPEATPDKIYAYVAKEARKRFPDYFEEGGDEDDYEDEQEQDEKPAPRRRRASPVEGARKARSKRGNSRHSVRDLTADERSIMRTVCRSANLTEAEYLKSYFGE